MLIVDFIKGPFLAALCREIALDTTNNLLRSAFRMSQTFKRARSLVVSDLRSETKGSRFESGCQLCAEVSLQ